MKKIDQRFLTIYISLFILISPFIDLFTGLTRNLLDINLSVGIIIKLLFLISIIFISIFIYKKYKLLPIYFIFFIYFIIYILGIFIYKDNLIFINIQNGFKILYFPILLITLYFIKDKFKISNMLLFVTLFIYVLLIFIPTLFNIGFKTYEITKIGKLGFFNSANEISGIFSILTPIMFIIFYENRKKLLYYVLLIIYLITILNIGTKTPLLSLIITLFFISLYFVFNSFKNKEYKKIFIFSLIVILISISSILFLPKTNFYKNIKTHVNYLKIDSIDDLANSKIVDHLIFSSRIKFLNDRNVNFNDSSVYEKLFGSGYTKNNKILKEVEIDYFDIYFSLGLVGFVLVISIFIYVLRESVKNKKINNFNDYMHINSLILIILLSIFTGHILTAPSVSLIVGIIVINGFKKDKKDLVFYSYNLNLGGIENSLINLVNRINSNKYNVFVILEKKEGVFLNKVNKNINVYEFSVNNNKNIVFRKLINFIKKKIYKLFYYNSYDFSCAYATYSYSSNVLARDSSLNNSLYIHSDYTNLYNISDFKKFFDSRNINEFKYLIFVSNEARDNFNNIYKLNNKSLVFNNFIEIDRIIKLSNAKVKESSKNKLFVFIGRLDDSSKKLSRAINIIYNIPDIDLFIVGDGPDKNKYINLVKEKKVSNRIKFLGLKTNPYPYMKMADYIILTSDYEGFPVTYLESIVLNKQIITTIKSSDDYINIEDIAYIISKDENECVKEINNILKKSNKKNIYNLNKIQEDRMINLEKIFDEV